MEPDSGISLYSVSGTASPHCYELMGKVSTMTASTNEGDKSRRLGALRSIEAAALAGLVHAVLSLIATYLLLRAPGASADATGVL